MKTEVFRRFTEHENLTWRALFTRLTDNRLHQAHPLFAAGVERLGLNAERVPDLEEVNRRLYDLTGWQGVPVEGLEGAESFYPSLAEKKFPIGNFIRAQQDINYTPAPDIFHDLYGHLPFFTDRAYADFNQAFGAAASRHVDQPEKMRMYERFYWFGLEFPLIDTSEGRRIFGGGLLSSFGESNYALSDRPEVRPFNLRDVAFQEFSIDDYQPVLFVLQSPEQLYSSLEEFDRIVNG